MEIGLLKKPLEKNPLLFPKLSKQLGIVKKTIWKSYMMLALPFSGKKYLMW